MKSCRYCRAGWGSLQSKLRYSPIDPDLTPHPEQDKDYKQSRRIKKARDWEKKEAKSIGGTPTKQSGAYRGDGDATLKINNRETQVEYKHRGVRKSFNLTLKEYEKGRRQGVEIYGIQITDETGKKKTLYMMDEDLFKELFITNE